MKIPKRYKQGRIIWKELKRLMNSKPLTYPQSNLASMVLLCENVKSAEVPEVLMKGHKVNNYWNQPYRIGGR